MNKGLEQLIIIVLWVIVYVSIVITILSNPDVWNDLAGRSTLIGIFAGVPILFIFTYQSIKIHTGDPFPQPYRMRLRNGSYLSWNQIFCNFRIAQSPRNFIQLLVLFPLINIVIEPAIGAYINILWTAYFRGAIISTMVFGMLIVVPLWLVSRRDELILEIRPANLLKDGNNYSKFSYNEGYRITIYRRVDDSYLIIDVPNLDETMLSKTNEVAFDASKRGWLTSTRYPKLMLVLDKYTVVEDNYYEFSKLSIRKILLSYGDTETYRKLFLQWMDPVKYHRMVRL